MTAIAQLLEYAATAKIHGVVCLDVGPTIRWFPTRVQAADWAWNGHFCTSNHGNVRLGGLRDRRPEPSR